MEVLDNYQQALYDNQRYKQLLPVKPFLRFFWIFLLHILKI